LLGSRHSFRVHSGVSGTALTAPNTFEIDGASHLDRTDENRKRQGELESLGIRLLRFEDVEVKKDLGGVLEIIKKWISEHPEIKG
jgi:very-short-patch-repair endonuclease